MANLLTDKGFIKTPNANDGYSTQNMYSRANLRTNLDIDLTATTKLKLNLLGTLSESRIPGASVNLWDMIYSIPSAAFPVRTEDDSWGGSTTWAGTSNPVAQSQGAAYSKGHSRSLFANLTLSQDLSGLLKGLGANFRLAYDNYSNILEDHSKTYTYAGYILPFQVANPVKWVRVQVLTTGRANLTLQVVSITIARFGSGMCILNSNGIMSIVIHTD